MLTTSKRVKNDLLLTPPKAVPFPEGGLPQLGSVGGDRIFGPEFHAPCFFVKPSDVNGAAHLVTIEGGLPVSGGSCDQVFHVLCSPIYKLAFDPPHPSRHYEYRQDYRGTLLIEFDDQGRISSLPTNCASGLRPLSGELWLRPFLTDLVQQRIGHELVSTHAALGRRPTSLTEALRADCAPAPLSAITADRFRHMFYEAYSVGRVQSISLFQEWSTSQIPGKQRIAGAFVLAKIDGEWGILFGQRDPNPDKPFPGFITVPVGKADGPVHQLTRGLEQDDMRRLLSLGIVRADDYQGDLESVPEAAAREAGEEVQMYLSADRLVGRIDDYYALGGRGLISLFVYAVDVDVNNEPLTTRELPGLVWLPLRPFLCAPEAMLLTTVDGCLRRQFNNPAIAMIPELRDIALPKLYRLLHDVIAPWGVQI